MVREHERAVKVVDLQHGVASSIGSLPHTDPRAAATFVLERQPRLPAAPSLPNRSGMERMVAQAAWGIAGIQVLADGSLELDDPDARPPRAAHHRGHRRRAVRRPARLPRRGGRSARADQAPAHRAGHARHRAAQPRRPRRRGPSRWPAPPCAPGLARSWRPRRRRRRWRRSSCSSTSPASPPRCTPASRSSRTAPSTSCRARWPPSSRTPSPACTAAGWPTGASCCRPAPQILSLPARHAARSSTPARSAPSSSGGGRIAWGAVPTAGPDRLHPRAPLAAPLGRVVRARPRAAATRSCSASRPSSPPPAASRCHGEAQADLVLRLTNQVARRLGTQTQGMRLTVGA